MGFEVNRKKGPISEINITPFVDVMLVLLVIFMISAPLMFSGVKLELPKTQKVSSLNLSQKQVIISLTKTGDIYLGEAKFILKDIKSAVLSQMTQLKTDVVYLRADYELGYGKVAKIISHLKKSGINKISLVTEIEKKKKD